MPKKRFIVSYLRRVVVEASDAQEAEEQGADYFVRNPKDIHVVLSEVTAQDIEELGI